MGEQRDDPDLHDEALEADIELLAEVIDHVSDHPQHLTREEIDEALGVATAEPAPPSEATPQVRPRVHEELPDGRGRLYG